MRMGNPTKEQIQDILPLTPLQEGMLYHYLQKPGSGLYFEQLCLEISGDIDTGFLQQAWNMVIRTNGMLRTVFRWEEIDNPVQIILKEYTLKPLSGDFSAAGAGERQQLVQQLKRRDKESGFDLRKVPFRITLCKLEACKHLLIISYHHILYDGWSNGIILKEFFEVYDQLRKGRTFNPPEKTKFKEFVKWINLRDRDKEETFWKNYLSKFEGYEGDRQQQLAGIHR